MSKRREHGPATASAAGSRRAAPAPEKSSRERAERDATRPEGGFEKSSQQERDSGIAPGEQPTSVETRIGSRMPDRK